MTPPRVLVGPTMRRFEHLLAAEVAAKLEGRIARRVATSGLREQKTLEAFDWNFQPNLDKATIVELGGLAFVRCHDDLVITGKSGTGKSHIIKDVSLRACKQGISLRYARCVDLLDDLYAGFVDNTYTRRLKARARPEMLIIDDVGLGQVKKCDDEPTAAHALFNLINRRHGRVSTAVTSNIAVGSAASAADPRQLNLQIVPDGPVAAVGFFRYGQLEEVVDEPREARRFARSLVQLSKSFAATSSGTSRRCAGAQPRASRPPKM